MQRGMVFDIQHYAVHDGPGIRTVVFLKGCPLECLWCCNPESQAFAPELRHSMPKCRICLACARACARGAIRATERTPVFDREICDVCSAPCVEACPQGALAVVGEWMTSDRVMTNIAADKAFYDNSGGGVTFSGGEPFAQPAFLEELLKRSKLLGIHTAIETCGHADPRAFVRCEPFVDLFFYDLKVMDCKRHEKLAGTSNRVILENLSALATKSPGKLSVRVPLVPGCTDDTANLEAIAAFLCSLGITKVEIMPCHNLGVDKYAAFGRDYRLDKSLPVCATEEAARIFSLSGLECEPRGE